MKLKFNQRLAIRPLTYDGEAHGVIFILYEYTGFIEGLDGDMRRFRPGFKLGNPEPQCYEAYLAWGGNELTLFNGLPSEWKWVELQRVYDHLDLRIKSTLERL